MNHVPAGIGRPAGAGGSGPDPGGGESGANLDGKRELRARVLAENGHFVEGALTGNKNFVERALVENTDFGARALAENDYFVEGGLVANFYSIWGALAGNGIVEETLLETECFLAEKRNIFVGVLAQNGDFLLRGFRPKTVILLRGI